MKRFVLLWRLTGFNPDGSGKHFEIKKLHFLKQKSDREEALFVLLEMFFFMKNLVADSRNSFKKKALISQSFDYLFGFIFDYQPETFTVNVENFNIFVEFEVLSEFGNVHVHTS